MKKLDYILISIQVIGLIIIFLNFFELYQNRILVGSMFFYTACFVVYATLRKWKKMKTTSR